MAHVSRPAGRIRWEPVVRAGRVWWRISNSSRAHKVRKPKPAMGIYPEDRT